MWIIIKEWVYQVAIGLDQWVNTWLGGSSDETMSCRCFRLNHIRAYRVLEVSINALFYSFQGADHCKNAYIKEVLGRHMPTKFYDLAVKMNLDYDREKLGDLVEVPK